MQENNKDKDDYSTQNFQWVVPLIEGIPPSPRGGHSATKVGRFIVFFGGHYYSGKDSGFTYLNDTYILDIDNNKWVKPNVSGIPPEPRYAHSAVLAGPRIIYFGGKGAKEKVFKDIHALDPTTMEWFEGPEGSGSPSARFGHSASLIEGNKIFIFGGQNDTNYFNDVYVLHLETMSWTKPDIQGPAPSPRFYHCAIVIGSAILIHGGFSFDEEYYNEKVKFGTKLKNFYLNDMRLLDTEKMSWIRLSVSGAPPTPRLGHSINVSGSSLILFGGWAYDSGLRKKDKVEDEVSYFKILNTEKFCWQQCKFKRKAPENRYGHTATSIGSHLLIFGGWEHNRATSEVVILRNLDVSGNQQCNKNLIQVKFRKIVIKICVSKIKQVYVVNMIDSLNAFVKIVLCFIKRVICPSCLMFGNHKGHNVLSFEDALQQMKEKFDDLFQKKQLNEESVRDYLIQIKHLQVICNEKKNDLKQKIKNHFNELRQTLNQKEEFLLKKISKDNKTVSIKLQNALEKGQNKIDNIKFILDNFSDHKENKSTLQLLLNAQKIYQSENYLVAQRNRPLFQSIRFPEINITKQSTNKRQYTINGKYNKLPKI